MTIPPDPADRPPRRPASGLDPLPGPPPTPPVSDVPEPGEPGPVPGSVPPGPDGRLALAATGREDRRRHVVDVSPGELGDPGALRARCGAPVDGVVPGLSASRADCPVCLLPT